MRRRAVFTSCHFWLSTAEEMLSSIVSQQVGKMRRRRGCVCVGVAGELHAYKCKFNVITRPRGRQLHPASERTDVLLGRAAMMRNWKCNGTLM